MKPKHHNGEIWYKKNRPTVQAIVIEQPTLLETIKWKWESTKSELATLYRETPKHEIALGIEAINKLLTTIKTIVNIPNPRAASYSIHQKDEAVTELESALKEAQQNCHNDRVRGLDLAIGIIHDGHRFEQEQKRNLKIIQQLKNNLFK